VDQQEVGRAALGEDAGAGLAEQAPAVDGCRGQGVVGIETGGDQRLDLPGELVGAQRAAAEVGAAAISTPAADASRTDSCAASRRSASADRPSAEANRGSRVVAANVSHDCITASVATSAVPWAAMALVTSASSRKPCSSASTPPATAALAPGSSELWAVTVAPRACTAATVRRTSPAVKGEVSRSGPSMYSFTRSAPSSSWPRAAASRPSPSSTSTGSWDGRLPVRASQQPAARTYG